MLIKKKIQADTKSFWRILVAKDMPPFFLAFLPTRREKRRGRKQLQYNRDRCGAVMQFGAIRGRRRRRRRRRRVLETRTPIRPCCSRCWDGKWWFCCSWLQTCCCHSGGNLYSTQKHNSIPLLFLIRETDKCTVSTLFI